MWGKTKHIQNWNIYLMVTLIKMALFKKMHKTATIFFFSPRGRNHWFCFFIVIFVLEMKFVTNIKDVFCMACWAGQVFFPAEELSSPQTELPSLPLCMCGEAHTHTPMRFELKDTAERNNLEFYCYTALSQQDPGFELIRLTQNWTESVIIWAVERCYMLLLFSCFEPNWISIKELCVKGSMHQNWVLITIYCS